jgi:hypothetical protein
MIYAGDLRSHELLHGGRYICGSLYMSRLYWEYGLSFGFVEGKQFATPYSGDEVKTSKAVEEKTGRAVERGEKAIYPRKQTQDILSDIIT